jgi:hypothetical protein
MARTGERYAAARAQVVGAEAQRRGPLSGGGEPGAAPPLVVNGVVHLPGIHPETTVLRILAAHAGIRDAAGGLPTEEAMLAVGGGPGAGVFAFHYEQDDSSSLYLAGRHRWEDPLAFVEEAIRRLGLEPSIRETGSRKAADRDLRTALEEGPAAVWVDLVELGYHGAPAELSGGAYHVVVVYAIDGDDAVVGDLAAEPIRVPLDVLARARARIVKHRNRLVTASRGVPVDLRAAAITGLAAGADALATERRRNFALTAFADLAQRMAATTGPTSWGRVFRRGRPLWIALASLHRFVETYSTGGGLLRPMLGRAVSETAAMTEPAAALGDAAAAYAALGEAWTAVATAALPDDAPLLAETRRLQDAIGRRFADRGPAAEQENRADWERLDELGRSAASEFPLSAAAAAALLADLADRMRAIHAAEIAALETLRGATSAR